MQLDKPNLTQATRNRKEIKHEKCNLKKNMTNETLQIQHDTSTVQNTMFQKQCDKCYVTNPT